MQAGDTATKVGMLGSRGIEEMSQPPPLSPPGSHPPVVRQSPEKVFVERKSSLKSGPRSPPVSPEVAPEVLAKRVGSPLTEESNLVKRARHLPADESLTTLASALQAMPLAPKRKDTSGQVLEEDGGKGNGYKGGGGGGNGKSKSGGKSKVGSMHQTQGRQAMHAQGDISSQQAHLSTTGPVFYCQGPPSPPTSLSSFLLVPILNAIQKEVALSLDFHIYV